MSETLSFWLELPGWYGMTAFVVGYALTSYKFIERGYFYQMLNLTGAIGFGFTGFMHGYMQSVGLEIIWGTIASTAMIKLWLEGRRKTPSNG